MGNKTQQHYNNEIDLKSLEGKILVASPHMSDPYFEKSLVYICSHSVNGSIGLIINQKIDLVLCNLMAKESAFLQNQNKRILNKKFPLLFGGPTNVDNLMAVSIDEVHEKFFNNYKQINLHTDINRFFNDLINKKIKSNKILFFKGMAIWDSMQLESEITQNDWLIVDASLDLIFSQKKFDKWHYTMEKLGIHDAKHFTDYFGNA